MKRVAWALIAIATASWLAVFIIATARAPVDAAYVAVIVICALATSNAVQSIRRDQVRFAAFSAGASIALCGYAALTHGWL